MMLYLIRCAHNLERLRFQIDTLYHPDNLYLISIDPHVNAADIALPERIKGQVRFFVAGPTTWGTERFLMTALEGMREGLAFSKRWKYLVLLSDTCIGHRRQEDLFSFLEEYDRHGIRNYLHASAPAEFHAPPDVKYTGEFECTLGTRPGVTLRTDRSMRRFFTCNDVSPIMRLELRASFHASEAENGVILCRPLFEAERIERQRFLEGWQLRFGSFFSVLSREACAWLAHSHLASAFLQHCKNFMFPEECYFATTLYAQGTGLEPGSNHNGNLHFRGTDVAVLQDSLLEEIKSSRTFFARKFVPSNSPRLTAYLMDVHGIRDDALV